MAQETRRSSQMRIYLFPGLGADHRLFQNLVLSPEFEVKCIKYVIPEKSMSMKEFAKVLMNQIDTESSGSYSLIGVSIGGMICCELNDLMKPEKVIIISSAKSRQEIPGLYKFFRLFPLNKMIPGKLYKIGSLLTQPIFEPVNKSCRANFRAMVKDKDPLFLKRASNMVIHWDRQKSSMPIIHIHGTKDNTIPIKKIKPDYIIRDGSHLMTYTHGQELSELINRILKDDPHPDKFKTTDLRKSFFFIKLW